MILDRIDRMMATARIKGFLPTALYLGKKEQLEMLAEVAKQQHLIVFDHRACEATYKGAAMAFTQEATQLRLESVMLNLEELLELREARPDLWPEPSMELSLDDREPDGSGKETG